MFRQRGLRSYVGSMAEEGDFAGWLMPEAFFGRRAFDETWNTSLALQFTQPRHLDPVKACFAAALTALFETLRLETI